MIETPQHRQTGRLTVRRITSRAYRVPLNFTLGTSVRTLKVAPLVLVDVQTEKGPVGRPGAIGAAILLVANEGSDPAGMAAVVAALLSALAVTFAMMIAAAQVQKVLGLTGVHVVSRVLGVLLAALAVQFVFDGVRESGLLN